MKKVTEKVVRYQVRGMLLPTNPGSSTPVFLNISGKMILPLFTSQDKFDEASKWGKFEFAKSSVIINPQDFQDCVMLFKKRFPFHVVIDPYITPEGNTRFQLAIYDDEERCLGENNEQKP